MWLFLSRTILLPLGLVGLALGAELLLHSVLHHSHYLAFLAAAALSALYGGGAAGLVATAASVALMAYLFVEPVGSLRVPASRDLVRLLVFSSVSLLVSALTREKMARMKAEARRAALETLLRAFEERFSRLEPRLLDLLRRDPDDREKSGFQQDGHGHAPKPHEHQPGWPSRSPARSARVAP